jgi:hypothetical protein
LDETSARIVEKAEKAIRIRHKGTATAMRDLHGMG